ncbi:hypothetical protein ACFLT4_07925 [Chloroflexota bacterium]
MITVTNRAKQELKRILSANVDNWYAGLRLVSNNQGGLGLGVDIEMPGDHVVVYDGIKVLLVAPSLYSSLKGIAIDIEDTDKGHRLVIC